MQSLKLHTRIIRSLLILLFLAYLSACKKLTEVPPPIADISIDRAFSEDGNAIAAITGLYNNMQSVIAGVNGLSVYSGLSADELTLYSSIDATDPRNRFYRNDLFPFAPGTSYDFWTPFYNYIYNCNAALSRLSIASTLTPAVKKQLTGEALFMRSFFYYYLLNFYGDVPLVLTTDYKSNASLSRTDTSQILQQLIKDLDSAQNLLSAQYLDASLLHESSERIRPSKGAAEALLARMYLYKQDWEKAEEQATLLINNRIQYGLNPLNAVFLKNSTEAIWQLQPVTLGWNTPDAQAFIIPLTGPDNYSYVVYLNNRMVNNFESGDQRKAEWIDSVTANGTTYYYPYKYKSATYGDPVIEYQMMLRLGEQYLIRSEARAQLGDLGGASSDLNIIRSRAGLPNTTATTKSALLAAILKERRIELFTELGQRWLDLKRTGMIDVVMQVETPLKANGAPWRTFQQLYPIPLADIETNPNLSQNAGY